MIADQDTPTIDHPNDVIYVEGTTGHYVVWSPSDNHPLRYEIYGNGTLIDSADWNGGYVTVNVATLALAFTTIFSWSTIMLVIRAMIPCW